MTLPLSMIEQGNRMSNDGMTEGGVEAVERALKLLEAFEGAATWLELRELAARSGLNKATILRTVAFGRGGAMPSWERRLDLATIRMLTVYVQSLGGTEPAAP